MDDPWGSPWNTATPDRSGSPTKSIRSAKSDLEPPPRAFLSASNTPRLPAASPWADDASDGFGDWSAADTGIATPAASGWGGGWDSTPQKGHLTPTGNEHEGGFAFDRGTSPITWPGNAASVGDKRASGAPSRHDPWASEDMEEGKGALDALRVVVDRPASPADGNMEGGRGVGELESPWEDETRNGYLHVETAVTAHDDTKDTTTTTTTTNNEQATEELEQIQPSVEFRPRSSRSRSSSGSRNGSEEQDTDRQDSPITSIDEDARSRLPVPQRKVSGRIQVLVEKFDGLAKAAADEPRTVSRSRSRSITPQPGPAASIAETETEDETADFGEFEDAGDVEERPVTPPAAAINSSPGITPNRSSIVGAQSQASSAQPSPISIKWRSDTLDSVSSDVKNVATQFSDVTFNIDLTKLDTLFKPSPSTDLQVTPEPIPDYPITDSFTTTSQRKTWYRISRQGSSRKHNFGDWDSYRRIQWQTSALHADVLKIVRRWMEQDSITGRTTLGGGTTKTDLFGWDSAAEPVALEKVFAARRGVSARPVSLQQPLGMPPTVVPEGAVPVETARKVSGTRPVSLVGPPSAAAFGWSSGGSEPALELRGTTGPRGPGSIVQMRPPDVITKPKGKKPVPLTIQQSDEDEDDWGEMISSPIEAPKLTSLEAAFDEPVPAAASLPTLMPDLSLRNSPTTQSKEIQSPSLMGSSQPTKQPVSLASTHDAWGSTDLSILDSSPKPAMTPTRPGSEATSLPTAPPADILPPATVSYDTPVEEDSAETESLIRRIAGNLPDLSYMLK